MPDETAPNDNTEKRLYYLSALCPSLSPHDIILSARFSLLSVHYQLIPALSPSLSPHNPLLSTRFILLSTAVIDVARLILPPVLPLPKEKAVS